MSPTISHEKILWPPQLFPYLEENNSPLRKSCIHPNLVAKNQKHIEWFSDYLNFCQELLADGSSNFFLALHVVFSDYFNQFFSNFYNQLNVYKIWNGISVYDHLLNQYYIVDE